MSVFDFFRLPDINEGMKAYEADKGALLIDVRSEDEYAMGHIPGSRSVPLDRLDKAGEMPENKDIPIYVYCRSGRRSRAAAQLLGAMGYRHVHNLGGIAAWRGKVEHLR